MWLAGSDLALALWMRALVSPRLGFTPFHCSLPSRAKQGGLLSLRGLPGFSGPAFSPLSPHIDWDTPLMWQLFDQGQLQYLEKVATDRPVARAILADRTERTMDEALRAAYTLARLRDEVRMILGSSEADRRHIMPPCTWCGELTGGYCEAPWVSSCGLGAGGMCAALCSECEEEHSYSCREHFIRKLLQPTPAT